MSEVTVVSTTAHRLLEDARTTLARADEQAVSALGAVSALITIIAVLPSGLQLGRDIDARGWICGLAISALATVLLLLAAMPRLATGSRRPDIAYFRAVSRIQCERDFGYFVSRTAEHPGEGVMLDELRGISKILVRKYRLMRFGILCSAVGSVLLLTSAI